MKFPLLIFQIFIFGCVYAQGIPNIDWSGAGVSETYDLDVPTVNFLEVKNTFTAEVKDDIVMNKILKNFEGGAIIYLPAGDYYFKKQIKLTSGFILRGDGKETVLNFELDKAQDCILAAGKKTDQTIELAAGLSKGQSLLTVNNTNEIVPGEYLYLFDNDERLITSVWSKEKTGQFVLVNGITENTIQIHGELRRDFPIQYQPKLRKCEYVKWVGIEKLSIVNNTKTTEQTSNISFQYAQNCWVGGVYSTSCNYSHVLLEHAVHCEVMGSNFKDAHDYGNGGKAYGITLQFGTGNCLILGNNLEHLRHSILLQAGANGNVIAKNISNDPFWVDVKLPADASGDIVLHGNYVYANLIEDNSCQTIVADNSHGKNGPDNFFFKNVINGYGIRIHRKSPGQAFLYNTLADRKWPRARYKVKGKQFEKHNTIRGKIKNATEETVSYKKSYWD